MSLSYLLEVSVAFAEALCANALRPVARHREHEPRLDPNTFKQVVSDAHVGTAASVMLICLLSGVTGALSQAVSPQNFLRFVLSGGANYALSLQAQRRCRLSVAFV